MSTMNFATSFWSLESLGVTAFCRSPLAGMPRSARSMLAAAGEFTHQLIQAAAASGFLVLLEADHNMLALYQALRSVALPVMLGYRSIVTGATATALTASSWFEL